MFNFAAKHANKIIAFAYFALVHACARLPGRQLEYSQQNDARAMEKNIDSNAIRYDQEISEYGPRISMRNTGGAKRKKSYVIY